MSSRPSSSTVCFTALFAELLVADVAGDGDRAAAFLLDDFLRLRGIVMLAQIEDRDVGALARKRAATARPMPLSAPVISATLPFSRSEPL